MADHTPRPTQVTPCTIDDIDSDDSAVTSTGGFLDRLSVMMQGVRRQEQREPAIELAERLDDKCRDDSDSSEDVLFDVSIDMPQKTSKKPAAKGKTPSTPRTHSMATRSRTRVDSAPPSDVGEDDDELLGAVGGYN